jgi:hypothetical protein
VLPLPATARDPAAATATVTATMAGQPMPAAGPATATSRYQPLLLLSATVTAVTPTLLVTASTRQDLQAGSAVRKRVSHANHSMFPNFYTFQQSQVSWSNWRGTVSGLT